MFEDQPQSEIDARRARDPEFRALHDQHRKLNKKCMDAELGVPRSMMSPCRMKREKLLAKQRLRECTKHRSQRRPHALTHIVAPGTA